VNDTLPPARRAGVVLPSLFALMALATFVALGTWQVERKAWKEALISALERRVSAPPSSLPAQEQWSTLDPANDEFRRVTFSAAFVPGEEALVYASGSALRDDVSGPGYWVFAVARAPRVGTIVVNRGFVPEGRQDPRSRAAGEPNGPSTMVGAMRWPEPLSSFSPTDRPEQNLWFVRDHRAIATAKGWGEVAPFFVELESPIPPGGLPHPAALKPTLRNEHLQYAITWYGLAIVVIVMFAIWLHGRRPARAI
jgi:surfeit locus 1 family protein